MERSRAKLSPYRIGMGIVRGLFPAVLFACAFFPACENVPRQHQVSYPGGWADGGAAPGSPVRVAARQAKKGPQQGGTQSISVSPATPDRNPQISPSSFTPSTTSSSERGGPPRPGTVPFGPGEKLVFKVSYFGVVAGNAILEVIEKIPYKGRTVYRIRAVAETSKFFSRFYRVRDVIEIFLDAEGVYPLAMMVSIEQGKEKYTQHYEYDQEKKLAVFTSGDNRKETPIPVGVQDSLSSLYYYRSLAHPMGETQIFDIYASKKVWSLETNILKKETIKTKAGKFATLRIKPVTKFEGVLQRRGDLLMWMSDDAKCIPVRLKVDVKFGSVYADLVSYNP